MGVAGGYTIAILLICVVAFPYMAISITIVHLKGGVGKTATTVNLAGGISREKKENGDAFKTLVVDLDPQANLTSTLFPFNAMEYKKCLTVSDVFNGEPIENCIVRSVCKGVDIIPSSICLVNLSMNVIANPAMFLKLRSAIQSSEILGEYDYILFDSPPDLGLFMVSGLVASDYYIIPMKSGCNYSMEGLDYLAPRIMEIEQQANQKLKLLGRLITFHDGRNSTCKSFYKRISNKYGAEVFDTIIRRNVDIDKAVTCRKTVFQHDTRVNGAIDYESLAKEVILKTRS